MNKKLAELIRKASNQKIGLHLDGHEVDAIDALLKYLVAPKPPKDPDRPSRRDLRRQLDLQIGVANALSHENDRLRALSIDGVAGRELRQKGEVMVAATVKALEDRRRMRQQYGDLKTLCETNGMVLPVPDATPISPDARAL